MVTKAREMEEMYGHYFDKTIVNTDLERTFDELKQALVDQLGIDYGETTNDSRFTLLPVCCLGACDGAPALMIDDDTYGPVTADDLPGLLEGYP